MAARTISSNRSLMGLVFSPEVGTSLVISICGNGFVSVWSGAMSLTALQSDVGGEINGPPLPGPLLHRRRGSRSAAGASQFLNTETSLVNRSIHGPFINTPPQQGGRRWP